MHEPTRVKLTIFLESALIAGAAYDTITRRFCVDLFSLESDDPAILLCFRHGLEVVLVTVEAEAEIVEVALHDICYIGLLRRTLSAWDSRFRGATCDC